MPHHLRATELAFEHSELLKNRCLPNSLSASKLSNWLCNSIRTSKRDSPGLSGIKVCISALRAVKCLSPV
ncbi:hypothetical protein M5D96_002264 [Drosophila gunungcola]|uniref:Uncharacterized protein n=1 Tax=Drosophila gunungcola TaxID=103775 RepID=A0A9P9Z0H3_9MUSC|nr:hypothetical protein M5D96_002264 [Drosophila gunungcola]